PSGRTLTRPLPPQPPTQPLPPSLRPHAKATGERLQLDAIWLNRTTPTPPGPPTREPEAETAVVPTSHHHSTNPARPTPASSEPCTGDPKVSEPPGETNPPSPPAIQARSPIDLSILSLN